jgi:hypothetical protein
MLLYVYIRALFFSLSPSFSLSLTYIPLIFEAVVNTTQILYMPSGDH